MKQTPRYRSRTRRALGIVFTLFVTASFSCCNRPKNTESDEVQKLRREVAEMKAQQTALATPVASIPTPVPETTLTGSVFYQLKSGDASILRTLRVYLMPPKTVKLNEEELKAANLSPMDNFDMQIFIARELMYTSTDYKHNHLTLADLETKASSTPFQATTDIDGKYKFRNIDPGDYYLFTTLNTTKATGFWFQKITVPVGQTTVFDLNNTNIAVAEDHSQ